MLGSSIVKAMRDDERMKRATDRGERFEKVIAEVVSKTGDLFEHVENHSGNVYDGAWIAVETRRPRRRA